LSSPGNNEVITNVALIRQFYTFLARTHKMEIGLSPLAVATVLNMAIVFHILILISL